MKHYFYLGQEKLVRLFVQKVLKGAGHEVYVTETLEELYVIKDLNSQIVLIDVCYVSSLSESFFESGRQYVVVGAEEDLKKQNISLFQKILKKPFGMTELLSL